MLRVYRLFVKQDLLLPNIKQAAVQARYYTKKKKNFREGDMICQAEEDLGKKGVHTCRLKAAVQYSRNRKDSIGDDETRVVELEADRIHCLDCKVATRCKVKVNRRWRQQLQSCLAPENIYCKPEVDQLRNANAIHKGAECHYSVECLQIANVQLP